MDISQLVRPHLQKFSAYSSARDECAIEASVYLDANENPLALKGAEGLNRYPDPHQRALKEELAVLKKVRAEQIFLGNGSDEAIDLLQRAFCRPGQDAVMILPPTYGMYAVCANLNNITVVSVPLRAGFSLDADAILRQSSSVKLIYICSPNNPTASLADRAAVHKILQNFKGLVIIDEAYGDFTSEQSWTNELAAFPNLVVLQTLSKAWGLAGIRVGMAYAGPEIISLLDAIKYPYNVSQLSQQAALAALGQQATVNKRIAQIIEQREVLANRLKKIPVVRTVYPSEANFLLVQFRQAGAVFNYLLQQGIVVRDRSRLLHCSECLRITVGTELENKNLIDALSNWSPNA